MSRVAVAVVSLPLDRWDKALARLEKCAANEGVIMDPLAPCEPIAGIKKGVLNPVPVGGKPDASA